ncbi:MAG: adenylosuccinate lyase [Bdellovibrionaceae bacterium]|nr:adenylosuccinate lyase [Pseudobdellovibrionaceae bacterium]
MIERYTRPEMGVIWELENRFAKMLEIEVAVAEAQAELGIIPKPAAKAIREKSKFSIKRINEIEKMTKHDVIAFATNVSENVGEYGRFVHFGMTSSDVLDSAFSLQVREAFKVLSQSIDFLEKSLRTQAKKHSETLCAGRTHGMFAEPTTFGLKLSGFVAELYRNRERLERAMDQMMVVKLSGAVGTYSGQPPEVEARVGKKLKLQPETVATQVVPRDRHAEVMLALAMLGTGLERLAIELRHLQRSEVSEVTEGFTQGQKGSSAMPHKKNPISAENITGAARLLRSYAQAALEDVALWHERDISHSSVERVIFPDAFILADYATHRMAVLIQGLDVNKKRMLENIALSQGQLFSSQVLLALVEKGLDRDLAYRHVQRLCHALGKGEQLVDKIKKDPEVSRLLKAKDLQKIFSGERNKKNVGTLIKRVL